MEERILEAALRVFAESGYRGATTRRIAAEAQINEVTLFRHFSTKEALIVAALERHAERMREILAAHRLPDEPRDVRAELTAYLEFIMGATAATERAHRTALGEWGQHPEIDARQALISQAIFGEVDRYIQAAIERGLIRTDASSAVITRALLGMLFADVLVRPTIPDYYPEDALESARLYCSLIFDGILAPGASDDTKD
ncbi:MAG TPA: TetR/AcrR family transcriptional regulator [Thermomicrobiales bacterium]|nr:TetR/AcrR family transcriptional regulator [Thermomicrobiales bacterium]